MPSITKFHMQRSTPTFILCFVLWMSFFFSLTYFVYFVNYVRNKIVKLYFKRINVLKNYPMMKIESSNGMGAEHFLTIFRARLTTDYKIVFCLNYLLF